MRYGAQVGRGELLSFRVVEQFARERYAEVATLARDAMKLLTPGDRAWCRTLSSLTPSLALTSQLQPVAELLDLLQDVEPTPEARPELRTTLACVGKRLVDIPAEADRRRYVVGVAFNARIVALAREWDLEVR